MRRDDALLLDMLLACQKIARFTHGMNAEAFQSNELVQSAVIREFQVLGDAARLITDVTRAAHPEIPWAVIAGMRNRLVHAYFDVRLDTVWNTIQYNIPPLTAALEAIAPTSEGAS
jgi:uncharacterized protein with HEPN domain